MQIRILKPNLHVPFKKFSENVPMVGSGPLPPIREHWRQFVERLYNFLINEGHDVHIDEKPLWMFTTDYLENCPEDLIFVPHKTLKGFPTNKNVRFYMQTVFPERFTVDPKGWGAEHSDYPFAPTGSKNGTMNELKFRINNNVSKFDQPGMSSWDTKIWEMDYTLFPCQLPHDENVQMQSNVNMYELSSALIEWATETKRHVLFKSHPANPGSLEDIKKATQGLEYVHWIDPHEASIHTLMRNAKLVWTINSGTGVEAMLHGRPVICFGRCEYDTTVARGDIKDMERTFMNGFNLDREQMLFRYELFFDWFIHKYTIDAWDLGTYNNEKMKISLDK